MDTLRVSFNNREVWMAVDALVGRTVSHYRITRLLGFDLLPRIKRINKVRLYRPTTGQPEAYARLAPALTRLTFMTSAEATISSADSVTLRRP